jgi:hypothetical protein
MQIVAQALTQAEQAEFARCEADIRAGLYQMWAGLRAISAKRLYRAEFDSFDQYVETRWGISARRAYQLIDAADMQDEVCTTGTQIPNERVARALLNVSKPERATVLMLADRASGGKLDTGWIESSSSVVEEIKTTGGYVSDDEGRMVAATAAVVDDRHERTMRKRQHIQDSIDRKNGTDPRHQGSATVISTDTHRGFITLLAPELAKALEQGKQVTYVVYVKVGTE